MMLFYFPNIHRIYLGINHIKNDRTIIIISMVILEEKYCPAIMQII